MKKEDDKSTWAIGGTTLMGVGFGLFLSLVNPIALPACILIGIGLGLVITPIISRKKV